MWRRAVLWQALLLLVSGTLDLRYYPQRRIYSPVPEMECFNYPEWSSRYVRGVPGGSTGGDWIPQSRPLAMVDIGGHTPSASLRTHLFGRRIDLDLSRMDEMVKEHAKLVQDINSLKQTLYVAPLVDRSRDYDDSIYLEAIETTTIKPRTTIIEPRTTTPTSVRSKKPGSSIPVILLGGASQHTVVRSHPDKLSKPTVSLVGTSITPLVKHPYPFVVSPRLGPPVRICMPSVSPTRAVYVKPKPSFLQRLLKGLVSR